jgi:hypothetical protein
MAELVIQVCGLPVGLNGKWGRCDRPPQHPTAKGGTHGCSTPELRTYMAKAAQKTRKKQKEVTGKVVETEEQREQQLQKFWEKNRKKLAPEKLAELLEQQERVKDLVHWMRYGHEVQPAEENYVSLADGHDLLQESVREHGIVESVERSFYDSHWWDWTEVKWWDVPAIFETICKMSRATETYARYGIVTGIPRLDIDKYRGRASKRPFNFRVEPEYALSFELDEASWLSGKSDDYGEYARREMAEREQRKEKENPFILAGPPRSAATPDDPLDLTKWVVPGPNPGLNLNTGHIPPEAGEKSRW